MRKILPTDEEEILSRVKEAKSSCWLWTGSKFKSGYGRIKISGKTHLAHRIVYELLIGPIPDELPLDHLCRTRRCAHPNHVEPVTMAVNVLRGDTIVAKNAAKTKCKRGHSLSGANLFVRNDGRRRCKTCEAKSQKKQREKPKNKAYHALYERIRRRFIKMGITSMKDKIFRQGDVLIVKISDDPRLPKDDLKPVERDRDSVVLAYGEVHGHRHRIDERHCSLYLDDASILSDVDAFGLIARTGGGPTERPEPDRILKVDEPVVLRHEEHDPIALSPGLYGIRRQREYDPEGLRAIED